MADTAAHSTLAPAAQPLTSEEEEELQRLLGMALGGQLAPTTFARCISLNDRKQATGGES